MSKICPNSQIGLIQLNQLIFFREGYNQILNKIADLLDAGTLKSTLTTTLEGFTVDNLKKAHKMQESGKAIGKTVILF